MSETKHTAESLLERPLAVLNQLLRLELREKKIRVDSPYCNYCDDLNALRQIEMSLSDGQKVHYMGWLTALIYHPKSGIEHQRIRDTFVSMFQYEQIKGRENVPPELVFAEAHIRAIALILTLQEGVENAG